MGSHLEILPNAWWHHQMETFSALLAICVGNSPVPDEFPAQRPVTRSFDVFFDLHPNKQLSKQWWGCWFETPSWSLWRHRNGICGVIGNQSGLEQVTFLYNWNSNWSPCLYWKLHRVPRRHTSPSGKVYVMKVKMYMYSIIWHMRHRLFCQPSHLTIGLNPPAGFRCMYCWSGPWYSYHDGTIDHISLYIKRYYSNWAGNTEAYSAGHTFQ